MKTYDDKIKPELQFQILNSLTFETKKPIRNSFFFYFLQSRENNVIFLNFWTNFILLNMTQSLLTISLSSKRCPSYESFQVGAICSHQRDSFPCRKRHHSISCREGDGILATISSWDILSSLTSRGSLLFPRQGTGGYGKAWIITVNWSRENAVVVKSNHYITVSTLANALN